MAQALVTLPKSVKKGDIIEIKALVGHPMETGFRPGVDGKTLPRDIIKKVQCRYLGIVVFEAEFFTSIAANPFVSFNLRATDTGSIQFTWEGDNGFIHNESQTLVVS